MERIIVLGIGNRLMMDDGIGIYLVEELAGKESNSYIQYSIGESDIDYCLEQMEGAALVIIVDAVISGKKPGEISIYPLAHLNENHPLDISPHNFHLFQALYQLKDKIKGYLIGVEPHEINFQIGLSEPLHQRWDFILKEVKVSIETIILKEKMDD